MLILFGLLAAVSNREVAEASEVWPGPGGMTATDGMHLGDAVLTWSMVQEEPHYRIGWIVASEYQENGFAGAHWETGFVFADVPNRGQASHLMSDLTAGEKYHFVVWGHHGNPDTPESSPPLATLQLADLPPAPSDQPSALSGQTGECGSRDGVRTDFQENWCIACYHDESGDGEYCLVVPLGFLDPEETDDWVRGIGEGAFAGLSGNLADIDDRKKYYRDILLEMAIQPAKRGDVFITLPEEVREATDVAELVAGSVDVYAENCQRRLIQGTFGASACRRVLSWDQAGHSPRGRGCRGRCQPRRRDRDGQEAAGRARAGHQNGDTYRSGMGRRFHHGLE